MEILKEDMTYSSDINLEEEISKLLAYLRESGEFSGDAPRLVLIKDDVENARKIDGLTAHFSPDNNTITLYTEGHHPSSLIKSYLHELLHYKQNQEGRLNNITTDNITEDENLAELEREAYEFSGMMFRKYKDSKKTKKLQEEYKQYVLTELFEKDLPNIRKISPTEYIVGNGEDIEAKYFFIRKDDTFKNWSINWSFTNNNINKSPDAWKQVTATSYKILQDFINEKKPISISISGNGGEKKTNIYKTESYLEKLKNLLNNKYKIDNSDEDMVVLNLIEVKNQEGILKRMDIMKESYDQALYYWQNYDLNAKGGGDRWSAIQYKVKREVLQEVYQINESYKIPLTPIKEEPLQEVKDKYGLNQFAREIMQEIAEEETPKYQIYCDMDTVLVEFNQGFKNMFGETPSSYEKKYGRADLINKINNQDVNFWDDLGWTQNGKAMWNSIKKYNPTIITSPSGKASEIGKRKWVNYNLGSQVPIIFSQAEDKPNYSGKNKILIDDNVSTIYKWISEGGIGIHFISAMSVVNKLKELGL